MIDYINLQLGKVYYFINRYDDGYLIGTGRLEMKDKKHCGFRGLKFKYWTTKLLRFNKDRSGWVPNNYTGIIYCDSLSVDTENIYEFENLNDAILYAEVM